MHAPIKPLAAVALATASLAVVSTAQAATVTTPGSPTPKYLRGLAAAADRAQDRFERTPLRARKLATKRLRRAVVLSARYHGSRLAKRRLTRGGCKIYRRRNHGAVVAGCTIRNRRQTFAARIVLRTYEDASVRSVRLRWMVSATSSGPYTKAAR